jgi:hypothetical protein
MQQTLILLEFHEFLLDGLRQAQDMYEVHADGVEDRVRTLWILILWYDLTVEQVSILCGDLQMQQIAVDVVDRFVLVGHQELLLHEVHRGVATI